MIISHKHKFIFIKTRKTAGTSLEIALSKVCGDEDVITPLVPEDEAIRVNAGFRTAQNYRIPFKDYHIRDWMRLLFKQKRTQFFNHIAAAQVMAHIPVEIWKDYYKFCFERNPWDKLVSMYFYKYPQEPRPSIIDFIQSPIARNLSNFPLYAVSGEVVVDHVYRYENLKQELDKVYEILHLAGVPALPNAKGAFRKDRRNYRELLTYTEREAIAQMCADEIALLGYEF